MSYDLQQKLAELDADYTSSLSVLKQRCVNVITKPTGGNDAKTANELLQRNAERIGLSGEWLRKYSQLAEADGRRLDACQAYVSDLQAWFKKMKVKCNANAF